MKRIINLIYEINIMINSIDKSIVEKFSDEFGCDLKKGIKFLIQVLYDGTPKQYKFV